MYVYTVYYLSKLKRYRGIISGGIILVVVLFFDFFHFQKSVKCDICELVIKELDSVIEQNATIDKINETLYQTCNKLPGALQDLVCINNTAIMVKTKRINKTMKLWEHDFAIVYVNAQSI